MQAEGRDRSTLIAFLAIVGLGGLNGISIRFSNQELDPFWGGALRFGLAAAVLLSIVFVRRIPLPRGTALVGSALYGGLGFGVTFGLVYWGLVETPAGMAQVIIALAPLLTLLLAVAHRLERFRWQGLIGSLVAVAGVAIVFGERLGGGAAPLVSMLAILAAAFAIAESGVLVKQFPRSHPVAHNAVAMGVGAVILFALALLTGERMSLPQEQTTLLAVAYLVVVGSVIVFVLFLYVIERWSASSTSYSLLLMPLITVAASAVLLNEPVTIGLLVGGALVLAGVYVGAFAPSLARPVPGLRRRPPVLAAAGATAGDEGPPELATPNCP